MCTKRTKKGDSGLSEVKVLGVTLDMINMRINSVHIDDYNAFKADLDYFETVGALPRVNFTVGKGISDYRYKLHIGEGGGAVYIGYQANGVNAKVAKERFDMKIEFNPAKHDFKKYNMLWKALSRFKGFKKGIKGFDIAYDINCKINDVMPLSLSGKKTNRLYGSYYFGQKGSNGFMKIYDKMQEEIDSNKEVSEVIDKTRFEVSIVFAEPTNLQLLSSLDSFKLSELYAVSVGDMDKLDIETKCVIHCLQTGFITFEQVESRRKREKIKKALKELGTIDFDDIYKQNKEHFLEQVKKCLNFDWYDFDKNSITQEF